MHNVLTTSPLKNVLLRRSKIQFLPYGNRIQNKESKASASPRLPRTQKLPYRKEASRPQAPQGPQEDRKGLGRIHHMLKKRDRLTTREIESLSLGKSVFGTLISLRILPAKKTKLAATVSKKIIKTAVDRNRMRRRIYAATEAVLSQVRTPAIVMIMPKKECLTLPFTELATEIKSVFAKAGLLG